jgi:hypothetical protein
VAIFSLEELRVVAWGEGHTSWVSAVAFDPWCGTCMGPLPGPPRLAVACVHALELGIFSKGTVPKGNKMAVRKMCKVWCVDCKI